MSDLRSEILSARRKKTIDVSTADSSFTWEGTLETNQSPTPFKLNCSDDCTVWCVLIDDYYDDPTTESSAYNFSYGDNSATLYSVNYNASNTIDGSTSGDLIAII